METRGILGSQTLSSSDTVLYSCHVQSLEVKHMQHLEMQKTGIQSTEEAFIH